jgi:hypothetical protein
MISNVKKSRKEFYELFEKGETENKSIKQINAIKSYPKYAAGQMVAGYVELRKYVTKTNINFGSKSNKKTCPKNNNCSKHRKKYIKKTTNKSAKKKYYGSKTSKTVKTFKKVKQKSIKTTKKYYASDDCKSNINLDKLTKIKRKYYDG